MIFITYKTNELKKLDENNIPRYKVINVFLQDKTIISGKLNNKTINNIVNHINDSEEQIYYEKVLDNYSYGKTGVNYVELWSKLFSKAEDKIKEIIKNNKVNLRNNIVIVNDNENLGPWQSLEVLTGLRHFGNVYWISVDKFIKTIRKATKKYSNESCVNQKVHFIELLKKTWKQV